MLHSANTCKISNVSVVDNGNSKRGLESTVSIEDNQKKMPQFIAKTEENCKRKRNNFDQASFKLEEYLEVMQPPSKARKHIVPDLAELTVENIPDNETSRENQILPNEVVKELSKPDICLVSKTPSEIPTVENPTGSMISTAACQAISSVDDEEWVRNHTSRELDLVDPEVLLENICCTRPENCSKISHTVPTEVFTNDQIDVHEELTSAIDDTDESNKKNIIIEAIRSNARLFIRNLPYTASEEELRRLFSSYGDLIEVNARSFSIYINFSRMMIIQIGTAYVTANDAIWASNLIDYFAISDD